MSKQIEQQADAFRAIRALMGYVQDGSETTVTLYQDDATRGYFVAVGGAGKQRHYHGATLSEAVAAAVKGEGTAVG